MELTPRAKAKLLGLTRYFTGEPCSYGHICERHVSTRRCVECLYESRKLGGAQYDNHRKSVNKRRRVGGSGHDAKMASNKRLRKVGGTQHQGLLRRRRPGGSEHLATNLRRRINNAIRYGYKAGSAVSDLRCSIYEFRVYIASMFHSGMAWDNWGSVWELDHIKCLASFDLNDRQQFLQACHFSNYQPLLVEDHRIKSATERSTRGIDLYKQEALTLLEDL